MLTSTMTPKEFVRGISMRKDFCICCSRPFISFDGDDLCPECREFYPECSAEDLEDINHEVTGRL